MIKQLQEFLYAEIPLTKDMGIELNEFDGKNIKVTAPLSHNINDKGSVFGGSSSALMIISAWSLIKLNCDKQNIDADIVIHKNESIWQKAMYQDLIIQARFKTVYDFSEIKTTVLSNKHKRITCIVDLVDEENNIYSTMTAKYVIIPKAKKTKVEA